MLQALSPWWLPRHVLECVGMSRSCTVRYGILMHFIVDFGWLGYFWFFYLCCQDTYGSNFIAFLEKKKKISTETPACAKCCCQDFDSHEADADAECHSSLEGVTLGSPVKKKKNQTVFTTTTALHRLGLACLLELLPPKSSKTRLLAIHNTAQNWFTEEVRLVAVHPTGKILALTSQTSLRSIQQYFVGMTSYPSVAKVFERQIPRVSIRSWYNLPRNSLHTVFRVLSLVTIPDPVAGYYVAWCHLFPFKIFHSLHTHHTSTCHHGRIYVKSHCVDLRTEFCPKSGICSHQEPKIWSQSDSCTLKLKTYSLHLDLSGKFGLFCANLFGMCSWKVPCNHTRHCTVLVNKHTW